MSLVSCSFNNNNNNNNNNNKKRYTNVDLKISLYVRVHIKMIAINLIKFNPVADRPASICFSLVTCAVG